MINSTARRRGRHAAVTPRPVPVSLPPPPAPRKRSSEDGVRLPGMEVLGFYDEPYVVRVAPPPRRIPRPVVTTAPPMTPATDATSRVASLWETTQIEESALEWWRPQVVARRRLGGSRVRVSTLGALAAAIFLIVLTISSVLSGRSEQVEQTRSTIITEAVALENLLPQLSDVVTALDDPTGPDLATSTEILLSAESTARRLFSAAG
ncbi:MAG TPA: hypothetical protein VF377_02450, partial [Acidimicrobiia bacterium]